MNEQKIEMKSITIIWSEGQPDCPPLHFTSWEACDQELRKIYASHEGFNPRTDFCIIYQNKEKYNGTIVLRKDCQTLGQQMANYTEPYLTNTKPGYVTKGGPKTKAEWEAKQAQVIEFVNNYELAPLATEASAPLQGQPLETELMLVSDYLENPPQYPHKLFIGDVPVTLGKVDRTYVDVHSPEFFKGATGTIYTFQKITVTKQPLETEAEAANNTSLLSQIDIAKKHRLSLNYDEARKLEWVASCGEIFNYIKHMGARYPHPHFKAPGKSIFYTHNAEGGRVVIRQEIGKDELWLTEYDNNGGEFTCCLRNIHRAALARDLLIMFNYLGSI